MAINFKSFFLFISAFLLNVQFVTPIDPATSEASYYSEQVSELVDLDRQEDTILFAQALFSELAELDTYHHFPVTTFVFNQDQVSRQQYQARLQLAFKNQSDTQLKISSNDHLIHMYHQSFSDESNTSALFQIS